MYTRRTSIPTVILASLALAFGLLALPSAGAAGGVKNVTTNTSYMVEETVFDSVTGETVNFSGEVRVIAHTKFLADGSVIVSFLCDGVIPGTGEKTGDHYTGKVHSSNTVTFNATGFPFTVTIQCDLRLANPGSCNDIEVPQAVQFTVQKNGSVSAQYVEEGGDTAP